MAKNRTYDISIIVPVFNAEKYLKTSLESLIAQNNFEKLEIILVDDGSVDTSLTICQQYANAYPNMIVFSQKNSGVSVARNVGIQNAHAEYIAFLDSDDYVESSMYSKLYALARNNNSDIAVVDFKRIYENGSSKKYRSNINLKIESRAEILKCFFKGGIIGNNAVDKLFKRSILNNIAFPPGYSIGEDMFFVYKALNNSNSVVIDTTICDYQYRIRNESAMNNVFSKKYFDTINLSYEMLNDFDDKSTLFYYAEAHLMHEKCKVLEYMLRNYANFTYTDTRRSLYDDIKKYNWLHGVKYLSLKQICGLTLMRISPKLYMLIHKLMKIG